MHGSILSASRQMGVNNLPRVVTQPTRDLLLVSLRPTISPPPTAWDYECFTTVSCNSKTWRALNIIVFGGITVRQVKLTHVSFRAHVKIASRIVS